MLEIWGDKKKLQKEICLKDTKSTVFPKKILYRYLEWTEGRGDNDKECTSTEGKTGQNRYEDRTTRQ